jgi:hypothetical protein
MKEVKQVDVLSAAKVSAALSAIWGFVAGLFGSSFMFPMAGLLGQTAPEAALVGLGFGLASVIIMPIVMAIVGFIGGAVSAFLYNIVAKYIGGVRIDF